MRLVVQRVNKGKVKLASNGKTLGEIEKGLFVLVGVGEESEEEDAKDLAKKLSKLRIMADDEDKMNLSVKDVGAKVLVVSQFTLYSDTSKGNRPSFIKAAEPDKAKRLYKLFVQELKSLGVEVETGSFGEYMEIEAQLNGPVTIVI